MGDISGAHVVQAQSHHTAEPQAVFVVSASAERAHDQEEKIAAFGAGEH